MNSLIIFGLVGHLLDGASTSYQLSRGCQEANPIYRSAHMDTPTRMALVTGGVSVAWVWGASKKSANHPHAVKWTSLALGVSSTALAVRNLRVHCSSPRP